MEPNATQTIFSNTRLAKCERGQSSLKERLFGKIIHFLLITFSAVTSHGCYVVGMYYRTSEQSKAQNLGEEQRNRGICSSHSKKRVFFEVHFFLTKADLFRTDTSHKTCTSSAVLRWTNQHLTLKSTYPKNKVKWKRAHCGKQQATKGM
jgi:hypothetical protein